MTSTLVLFIPILTLLPMGTDRQAQAMQTGTSGVCLRDGERIAGVRPIEPKQGPYARGSRRRSQPDFPPVPPGAAHGGTWVGEVLIGTDGKVVQVWTIQHGSAPVGSSEVDPAVLEAVWRWEVEPLMLNGRAVPACVSMVRFIS